MMDSVKVSYIIPTYNFKELLKTGLDYLADQRLEAGVDMEVVVIDDGSSDGTHDIVNDYAGRFTHFVYVYRARDERSCRSRTRNLGIRQASGDVIVFLDAGVLVGKEFTNIVAARFIQMSSRVLYHRIAGLEIDPQRDDMSPLAAESLTPDNLPQVVERLSAVPGWGDEREGVARANADDLSRLALPWAYGMTCAMSVPAELVRQAGGFEERFLGWGCEDVEFALRLFEAQAVFHFEREACALHLPHPKSHTKKHSVSHANNAELLHKLYGIVPTELMLMYPGLFFDAMMLKLQSLQTGQWFGAAYKQRLADGTALRAEGARTLLIGMDDPDCARSFGATHLLAYNETSLGRLRSELPDVSVSYSLGCRTFFTDGYFDTAVITDFIRLLHPALAAQLLREAGRVAKTVVLLLAGDEAPPQPKLVPPAIVKRLITLETAPAADGFAIEYAFVPGNNRAVMERYYWSPVEEMAQLAAQLLPEGSWTIGVPDRMNAQA
ncbi:glycosyltransferase family 2 protein [Paenibacillus athensensis]|nr:glycosyltransferase family 2 protein [Paenibacillus athensensis]MCD1257964.1 glycosyltransferase family 2 protein [Paenibacillus athensensis]